MTFKAQRAFLTLVMATLVLGGPARVKAETELGNFCWGFSDFGDVIRLTLVQSDSAPDTFTAAHGRWQFPIPGPAFYQLEVSGHISLDNVAGGGNLALGITGSHRTPSFGGDQNCSLNASLNPDTLSGPYTVACSPGPGPAPFTVSSGTINAITCPDGAAPQQRVGPGIGAAVNEAAAR
jgi:hypothetical protein